MATHWEKALAGAALTGGLFFFFKKRTAAGNEATEAPGEPAALPPPEPKPKPPPRPKPKRPHRDLGPHVNRSSVDVAGSVRQSLETLLGQARKFDPDVTADELAAARLIASEYASGTETEWAAIVDAELNRAERAGRSLMRSLTGKAGRFGKQGSSPPRPASTRRDPRRAHLAVAIAVVRGGEMRGVSRGATRFFRRAYPRRFAQKVEIRSFQTHPLVLGPRSA